MQLRAARIRKLLTIRDMANAVEISDSTVRAIESGEERASPDLIRRISETLQVDPSEIYEFR